MNIQAD